MRLLHLRARQPLALFELDLAPQVGLRRVDLRHGGHGDRRVEEGGLVADAEQRADLTVAVPARRSANTCWRFPDRCREPRIERP